MIKDKFAELKKPGVLKRQVDLVYQSKQGIANPMVSWRYLTQELLDLAMQRIPLDHWFARFNRLLLDTRSHRSGLPDLIVFPDESSACESGYRLVEVKGPGDSLQKNQIRWMRFFAEHGIDHAVCHVTWCNPDSTNDE